MVLFRSSTTINTTLTGLFVELFFDLFSHENIKIVNARQKRVIFFLIILKQFLINKKQHSPKGD
jgi:hypothetical protein